MGKASKESAELVRAALEARIASLEAALEVRARELRTLQQHCCARDLELIERLRMGLSPTASYAYEPALWLETHELAPAEVEPVLEDLWRSLPPREVAGRVPDGAQDSAQDSGPDSAPDDPPADEPGGE